MQNNCEFRLIENPVCTDWTLPIKRAKEYTTLKDQQGRKTRATDTDYSGVCMKKKTVRWLLSERLSGMQTESF